MHANVGKVSQSISNPLVLIALATLIVVGLGAIGSLVMPKNETAYSTQAPERVIAMKKMPVFAHALSQSGVSFAPAPIASAAPASGSRNAPQIARTGTVSLFAGSVSSAVGAVTRLAHMQRGDVFSLEVDDEDATNASAQMEIRVPADRFERTMTAIGGIGKVRQRSVSGQDLTSDITDSSARLRNLRRTEADIRMIMDRSGSVGQVLDAENQLSQVREQIETLQSDIASMRNQVAYSSITVSIQAEASSAAVEPTAASQLATAWHAAVHALSQTTLGLLGALLWLAVFLPYVLVAGVIGWFIYGRVRNEGVKPQNS